MPGIEGFGRGTYTRAASSFAGAISGEAAGVFVSDSVTGRLLRSELLAPLASSQNLPTVARAEAMAAVNNPGRLSALARSLAANFRLSRLLKTIGPISFLLTLLQMLGLLTGSRSGTLAWRVGNGFSSACPFAGGDTVFPGGGCPPAPGASTLAVNIGEVGMVNRTSIGGNSYVESFTIVGNVRPNTATTVRGDAYSTWTRTVNYGIALATGRQFARDSKWTDNVDPHKQPRLNNPPMVDPGTAQRPQDVQVPLPIPIPWSWLPYRKPNPAASPSEQSQWGPARQPRARSRTRTRTDPAPQVTPLPGTSGPPAIILYPPGVIAPDTWRPPARGEKERKKPVHRAIMKGVNGFTEGLDELDALYDALPAKLRRRERAKRHGKDPSVLGKLQLLWAHINDVDLEQYLQNHFANEREDRELGELAKRTRDGRGRSLQPSRIPNPLRF